MENYHGHTESKNKDNSDSFCQKTLHALSYITVEPAAAGSLFILVMYTMLAKQYVYLQFAKDYNLTQTDADTSCNETTANASDPTYILIQQVSTETAQWTFYLGIATFIPALFSTIVLASWSDKYGRKFPILVSLFGFFILMLGYVIVVNLELPVPYLLIGHFLCGLCGDSATLLACSFSYITDITQPENRTWRITIVETCLGIGGFVASITGGIWINNKGFVNPFWFLLCLTVVDFVYIVLRMESQKDEKSLKNLKQLFTKEPFVHMYHVLKRQPDNKERHINILLFLTSALIIATTIIGASSILVVYEIGLPFCWNSVQVGISQSLAQAGNFIILALVKIFSNISAEVKLLILGLVSNFISSFILAFAVADWMIFFGLVVQMVYRLPAPIMRSQASRLVPQKEVGPIFALLSCAVNIASVIGSALYNLVFGATVDSSIPGVAFLLSPILVTLFSLSYRWTYRRVKPALYEHVTRDNEDFESCKL